MTILFFIAFFVLTSLCLYFTIFGKNMLNNIHFKSVVRNTKLAQSCLQNIVLRLTTGHCGFLDSVLSCRQVSGYLLFYLLLK